MANSVFLGLGDWTFTGSLNVLGNLTVSGSITGGSLIATQGTLTADAQALSTTATWNNAGVTFTGWKQNITDTASDASSLLLDMQVSGVSKFRATKSGTVVMKGALFFGTNGSRLVENADGVILFGNNAGTDFSRLQFGGTTSSFPSLKRASQTIEVRLADDSGYGSMTANSLSYTGAIRVTSSGTLLASAAAPTISSGFGTSPSISSNNGTASFRINVGTGGAATSGVVGLPTASNGWNAFVSDLTGGIATRVTASSTTSITITGASAWASGSTLQVIAMAY